MTTEQWVKRLNALAKEIEWITSCVHPSAWKEQGLSELAEKYKKLAGMEVQHGRDNSYRD